MRPFPTKARVPSAKRTTETVVLPGRTEVKTAVSCLAQSVLQRAPTGVSTSEQFAFAKGETTFGQRCRAITREVFHSLLSLAKRLFAGGYSCEQVAEVLMPA